MVIKNEHLTNLWIEKLSKMKGKKRDSKHYKASWFYGM